MLTWQTKWEGIKSKLQTCRQECRTDYRADQRCKDSIEAVMADIWNLKDWLKNDPAAGLTVQDLHTFIETPDAFNIRGCADLTTLDKHLRVDDPHRNDTQLRHEGIAKHADGFPIVYSATRDYGDGNIDHWEDAVELAIRGAMEWEAFLVDRGLLTEAVISGSEVVTARFGRRFGKGRRGTNQ